MNLLAHSSFKDAPMSPLPSRLRKRYKRCGSTSSTTHGFGVITRRANASRRMLERAAQSRSTRMPAGLLTARSARRQAQSACQPTTSTGATRWLQQTTTQRGHHVAVGPQEKIDGGCASSTTRWLGRPRTLYADSTQVEVQGRTRSRSATRRVSSARLHQLYYSNYSHISGS